MAARPEIRKGWPAGERHHRARLSDEDVRLMRELREAHGLTIREIADKFEANYNTVASILQYRSRYAA